MPTNDPKQTLKPKAKSSLNAWLIFAVVLMLLLAAIALGTWVLDSWLSASITRFGIFWGVVTLYTLLLLLLTIYDMLRAKRGG